MKTFLVLCMTAMMAFAYGQTGTTLPTGDDTKDIALVFDQKDFGNRFSVLSHSDDSYDYYAIDLTKLGGQFERVYFMNLTYQDPRIINLDSDLNKDQTWFKSYFKYKEDEITCLFKDLKDKTINAGSTMTTEEKAAWMAKNNKFNK